MGGISARGLIQCGEGAQEKVGRAEIAGFERQRQGRFVRAGREAHRPRHAGIDLPADAQAGHAKRLHHRARGLAAGDDEAAHAARDEAGGDLGHDAFDQRPGRLAAELLLDCGDGLGRRGRGDEDRRIAEPCPGPGQRLLGDLAARRGGERIDREDRRALTHISELRQGGLGARARQHRCLATDTRQDVGAAAIADQLQMAEIRRQAERDPRAAGDQCEIGRGLADRLEVAVGDRIDDRMAAAAGVQLAEGGGDCLGPLGDRRVLDEPDLAAALCLENPHQGRVAHPGQRVVLHSRFG